MLSAAALVAGLGAGFGLAFLLSQLRPVFDDRRLLGSVTGYPVLGTVSLAKDARALLRERTEFLVFALFTGLLIVALGLVVVLDGIQLPVLERLLG